jgi:hypothetical protein
MGSDDVSLVSSSWLSDRSVPLSSGSSNQRHDNEGTVTVILLKTELQLWTQRHSIIFQKKEKNSAQDRYDRITGKIFLNLQYIKMKNMEKCKFTEVTLGEICHCILITALYW